MNCIDPVRDRLVAVTDQTVDTSNHATVAVSLSRDRTALHISALKLRTSEHTKAEYHRETQPTTGHPSRPVVSTRQPAKPVLAGPGVKGERSESTGGQRGCP